MCLDSRMACLGALVDYGRMIQRRYALGGYSLTNRRFLSGGQKKLAFRITKAQLLVWKLGKMMNEGKATTSHISLAKRNNVAMALDIAREARQIHGGMGITGEYPIMRHMMNLESVVTYEGTHDIHLLILGHEITGIAAFK